MGSITFQAVGDASIGTKTKTYSVSDADMNRFKNWAIGYFATRPTAGQPAPPALTVTQALTAWADACMINTKNSVVDRERNVALTAVVPPLPFVAT